MKKSCRRVAILWLLGSMGLAGCGDPELWDRWQAQRLLWEAHRQADQLLLRPGGLRPEDYTRLEKSFRQVVEHYPAARWVPLAASPGSARDVAAASGDAALVLGELLARSGHEAGAVTQWRRTAMDYASLPDVVLEARISAAELLARLGRHEERLALLGAVVDSTPLLDSSTLHLRARVLPITLQLAREWQDLGEGEQAARMLRGAEQRFSAALDRPGMRDKAALASALAEVRGALGDTPGSLEALRSALAASPQEGSTRILALAQQALALGAPDSVFSYARWAIQLNGNRHVAGAALLLIGRAFEQVNQPDSALATYNLVFQRWRDPGVLVAETRFRRASLLERLGRWELARGEYRTLAAGSPNDPLALQGLQRIVQHHLDRGEFDLAEVEGDATLGNLTQLLATNLDPKVQRAAQSVRAELLLSLGRVTQAESSMVALWQRFPGDSATEDAALRSAQLALHQPGGDARARKRFEQLRRTAGNATVRRAAGLALLGLAPATH